MDPHLPSMIGPCVHCAQPLYASGPVAKPTVLAIANQVLTPLAHVGCAVDSGRVR